MSDCWCGNTELLPFSAEYGVCSACGTLVSVVGMSPEELQVSNDETDFYGKQYWLAHQSGDLGFPDIYKRARDDLTERNLHWLKTLLKYRLPPAKVLELGCSHGSFVALLRQAGYEAAGVEMSPWVVEFGQKTFGVPISVGPIENLGITPGSLDVIALMDVLEHLPDPVTTMAHCLQLLNPNGILLIQTPQFKNEMDYTVLVETKAAFLEQLKADEHLYLFSDRSVARLFQQLGADHVQFEPAIFDHYDMFLAVSREPLQMVEASQAEDALLASSNGRLSLALLDLRARELRMTQMFRESETDRAARAEQIAQLTVMVRESETDRAARGEQIAQLTAMLRESETDRAARAEQIAQLTVMLKADPAARAEQIEQLTVMLRESEADRAARAEQIEQLTVMLRRSEDDRATRTVQIEQLTVRLRESEADRAARAEQIEQLTVMLRESEADRAARSEQIEKLMILLKAAESDCAGQGEQLAACSALYRTLSTRPAFRALEKLAPWPELKELSNRIGKSNEQ